MSDEIFAAVHARPKRRQGITGQTIDAQMRGTICQITELELEELRAELARLRAEVERLTAALSTVQRAARTLHAAGQEITRNAVAAALGDAAALREVDRTEYTAAANLDSERQANAMLTEALERAEAALADERAHADALAEALTALIEGGNRQLALISRRVKVTDPMTLIVTKGQMLAAIEARAAHRARRQG